MKYYSIQPFTAEVNKTSMPDLSIEYGIASLSKRFGKPWQVTWPMLVSCLQQMGFAARQQGKAVDYLCLRPEVPNYNQYVFGRTLLHPQQQDGTLLAYLKPLWQEASTQLPEVTLWKLELHLISLNDAESVENQISDFLLQDDRFRLQEILDKLSALKQTGYLGLATGIPDQDPYRLAS